MSSTQEVNGATAHFNEVLIDKDWGHSFAPNHTAFNKNTGYSRSLFEYFGGEVRRQMAPIIF